MIAWNDYKRTEDYQNIRKWALIEQHVDGSLWAAFSQGWFLAENQNRFRNQEWSSQTIP